MPNVNHDSSSAGPEGDALLQAILESAVDGVITIDDRGTIESLNPAAERLFGYDADEIIGQNVKVLMPSPYQDRHDSYLRRYLETGEKRIIGVGREVEGRRKDGSTFPMYLSVSEIHVGQRRFFTGIVHDLTQLKEMERSAARMGRILDDSLNEIFIFDADTLRFELVNRGARNNLGYSMDELRRMTPLDIKPQFTAEAFAAMLAPLRQGDAESISFETVHARKDGSQYPVEVRVQLSQVSGETVFVAIILDISERLEAESERSRLSEELKRRVSELRIRDQALESAGEGVMIVDAHSEGHPIVYVNHAFESMTGFRSFEIVGRTCVTIHGDDTDQPGVVAIKDALTRSVGCHVITRSYRNDGTMFWNEMTLAPVKNGESKPRHIVAVMQDITEKRQTHERLVQSERLAAIGEMVAGLAHESRNALQRAQACLDNLTLDLEEQPEQLNLTKRVGVAIDDLRRLYEEVRNYAAPLNLQRRRCKLGNVMRKTWDDLTLIRGGRRIELFVENADSFPECRVDDHRMGQVFRNIFENAIVVCPDPGRVVVSWRETTLSKQPALEIHVSDNGPGLEPDVAQRVFQPFFTTKQKGTGLGMAIVKRIIEAHGGNIEIGEAENSGAAFTMKLPL